MVARAAAEHGAGPDMWIYGLLQSFINVNETIRMLAQAHKFAKQPVVPGVFGLVCWGWDLRTRGQHCRQQGGLSMSKQGLLFTIILNFNISQGNDKGIEQMVSRVNRDAPWCDIAAPWCANDAPVGNNIKMIYRNDDASWCIMMRRWCALIRPAIALQYIHWCAVMRQWCARGQQY